MTDKDAIGVLECMSIDMTGCIADLSKRSPMFDVIEQRLEAINVAQAVLREKLELENKAAPPVWVVCFRCCNSKKTQDQKGHQVRICHKCTRNSFAPCGMEKEDWFNREVPT